MAAKKPKLILLHGALGTPAELKPLVELLQDHYDCLTPPFRGHGDGAAAPNPFRTQTFTNDLEYFVNQLNGEDYHLFGYSMGGYVAMQMLSQAECPMPKSLTTYGTKFDWTTDNVAALIQKLDVEEIPLKAKPLHDKLQKQYGDKWTAIVQGTAHMMEHLDKLDGLRAADVSDISTPIKIIRGSHDRLVSAEESQRMANWITSATYLEIAGSGHELEKTDLAAMRKIMVESH